MKQINGKKSNIDKAINGINIINYSNFALE